LPPDKLLKVYWRGKVDTSVGVPPSIEKEQVPEVVVAVIVAEPMFCPHVVFTTVDVTGSETVLFT
jgi:hypothetical protein